MPNRHARPARVLWYLLIIIAAGVLFLGRAARPKTAPLAVTTSQPATSQPTSQPVSPEADPFAEEQAKLQQLIDEDRLPEAVRAATALLATRDLNQGPQHPQVGDLLLLLGNLHTQNASLDAGEAALLRALDLRTALHGDEHESVAEVWLAIARLFHVKQDWEDAREAAAVALETCQKTVGKQHAWTAGAHGLLGDALSQSGRLSRAEPHLRKWIRWVEANASLAEKRDAYERMRHYYDATGDRAQEALWRGKRNSLPATPEGAD